MFLAYFCYGFNYKLVLKSHALTIEDTLVSVFCSTNLRLGAIEEVGRKITLPIIPSFSLASDKSLHSTQMTEDTDLMKHSTCSCDLCSPWKSKLHARHCQKKFSAVPLGQSSSYFMLRFNRVENEHL